MVLEKGIRLQEITKLKHLKILSLIIICDKAPFITFL